MSNLFDITVVLNCHNEKEYIKATLTSLGYAIEKALDCNLTVELVVVIDAGDKAFLEFIESICIKATTRITLRVDYHSLGLSRNAGINIARGKYILLCDADDLVSENTLCESYQYAQVDSIHGLNCVYVPQFILSFGERNRLQELFSSKYFLSCDLIEFHPFCSRLFFPRALSPYIKFEDFGTGKTFSFEDWELNINLFSQHIEIKPTPKVILFYRKRRGSIMSEIKKSNLGDLKSAKEISFFFDVKFNKERVKRLSEVIGIEVLETFLSDDELLKMVFTQSGIDSDIPSQINSDTFEICSKNIDSIQAGFGYRIPFIVALAGYLTYERVVIIPAGAEAEIARSEFESSSSSCAQRTLILLLDKVSRYEWLKNLPESCFFLSLNEIMHGLSGESREMLLFRLLRILSNSQSEILILQLKLMKESFPTFIKCFIPMLGRSLQLFSGVADGEVLTLKIPESKQNPIIASESYDDRCIRKKIVSFLNSLENKLVFSPFAPIPFLDRDAFGDVASSVDCNNETLYNCLVELENSLKVKKDIIEKVKVTLRRIPFLWTISKLIYRKLRIKSFLFKLLSR